MNARELVSATVRLFALYTPSMRRIDVPSLVAAGVKTIAGLGLLLAARRQNRGAISQG